MCYQFKGIKSTTIMLTLTQFYVTDMDIAEPVKFRYTRKLYSIPTVLRKITSHIGKYLLILLLKLMVWG